MSKLAIIAGLALAFAGTHALAQEASPETVEETEAPTEGPKVWYVMIAVEQAVGPRGCRPWHYKISTARPIVIEGPPEVRPRHADEVAAWWMIHLRHHSSEAFRWLAGPDGHEPAAVYFRESAEEVVEAFRADGHLRLQKTCTGSKLIAQSTAGFRFVPPEGFTQTDFGFEPVPETATVARDLPRIPGAR